MSGTAVTPRPRPPGARKASNRTSITRGTLQVQQGGLLAPSPAAVSRRNSVSSARLDCDLDLDLPSDLTTAALERSPHVWPLGARRSSQTVAVDDATSDKLTKSSLSRSMGHKVSRGMLEASLNAPQLLASVTPHSEGSASPEAFKHGELAPEARLRVHDDEADSSGELDEEWVGRLPREELEQLLMQANHVIRERERDLGIAAAIGKALLEKNMSLRTKHNGIVKRLESVANLHELAGNTPPQLYSPPTTDVDATSQRGDDENATPMPASHHSDYFTGVPSDPAVAAMAAAGPSSQHLSTPHRGSRAGLPAQWQPSLEGLVASAPPSPSASFRSQPPSSSQRHRTGHQRTGSGAAAAAEAQRQLAVLSSQNDTLVAQLTELQYEAEEAKRDGGRRVRKLNKEIDGLRGELDAAVERNMELEQAETEVGPGSGPRSAQKPRLWRRRSRNDVWGSASSASQGGQPSPQKSTLPMPASTTSLAERPSLSALLAADRLSQSGSVTGLSESGSIAGGLESLLGYAPGDTPGERAIVAQLMSKIKELEDTNAMLAKASTDVDGRLGRALQEGERIRDAYDVVEASSNAGMDEYTTVDSPGAESSLGGLSPAALRRRAAGNRHMIEGRRTIRAALRREAAINALVESGGGMSRSATNSSLASTVSSAVSSPRASRRTRVGLPTSTGLIRPRILITPSMEDLAARRRQDEEWEEEQNPRRSGTDWLNPADAQRAALMRHAAGAGGSRSLRRMHSGDSLASSNADEDVSPSPTPARRALAQLRPGQIIGGGGGMTPSTSVESNMDAQVPLKSYDSVSEFNVAPSVSGDSLNAQWAGARHTLGSELGSVFGDAERNMDQANNDMRLSELGSPSSAKLLMTPGSASTSRFGRTLRPVASNGSLRGDTLAPSEAASDIADLRWSVASGSTIVAAPSAPLLISGTVGAESGTGIPNDALTLPDIDAELLRQFSAGADGEWPDEADELVARGALRDQVMTSHESYDLLETATRRRPIHWADDDDFGKPITESDARKLGLLGWVRGEPRKSSVSHASRKGKAREGLPASTSRLGGFAELESAEQVEERQRTSAMLRQKRLDGLKARVQAGQLDANKAVMLGLGLDDANSAEEQSLEQEVDRVALALAPTRRRRASRAHQTSREASSSKTSTSAGPAAASESSDEAFEMLDLDPTRRRPRRGTDFYPVDRVARYKPSMVKQRVKVASNDAVSWATAWASFSMMVFFAFIVTFARGPKRVLGTPARQA